MRDFPHPRFFSDAMRPSLMTRRFRTRGLKRSKPPGALVMLAIFVAVVLPAKGFALHRVDHHHRILRSLRLRGVRRLLWNPMFRPSHDSLIRQNEEIDRLDLPRISDDAQLEELKASGDLVQIEENEGLHFDRRL